MDIQQEEKLYCRVTYFILLITFIGLVIFTLFIPIRLLVFTIPDDASYYFKIAENAANGYGLTFDGINKTNGYQPLWQYLLIPVFIFLHADQETMFRICIIFQLIILFISGLVLIKLLNIFFKFKVILLSVFVYIFLIFFHAANGMESAVLVLTLLCFFLYAVYYKPELSKPINDLIYGLLLGLVMLSRMDLIFFGLIITLALTVKFFRNGNISRYIFKMSIIVFGASILLLPFLIYNYITFDSIIPISAALKTGSLSESLSVPIRAKFENRVLIFTAIAFIYFLWFVIFRARFNIKNNNIEFFNTGLFIFSVSIIIHFLHTIFFMKWAIFPWHFIPYRLFVLLVFSYFINYLFQKNILLNNKIIYWLFIIILCFSSYSWVMKEKLNFRTFEKSWNVIAYNAALWARDNTGESDIFAMSDNGHFGFFSNRKAVNLDGVVNNYEYQDAIRNKKYLQYFKDKKINYLAQYVWNNNNVINGNYNEFAVFSLLYGNDSLISEENLLVYRKNEVYSSNIYQEGNNNVALKIWKISY